MCVSFVAALCFRCHNIGWDFPNNVCDRCHSSSCSHQIQCLSVEVFSPNTFCAQPITRPVYIGKNQNPKNLGFTVYTARKTHNIRGFWHEKRMREKTWISYWCFGKWCACATSLYLWPYLVRITSRAAVGWFRRRSRTTWPKTWIIPARLEQAFTLEKKNLKNRRSFKKSHSGGGFFDSVFFCSV